MPNLPEVVVGSTEPLLLVTRRVKGTSLFAVADSIDRDQAGLQLARFLAALNHSQALTRAEAEVGPLPAARPLAATEVIRDRFAAWVDTERYRRPEPTVLVHADLHGDNQVWDGGELRVVVDFETVGVAWPEYDLGGFPGPGLGPGVELLTALVRHYQELAGRPLSMELIMAGHIRMVLGDVVWRTDLGIHLADHRTPPDWVDDADIVGVPEGRHRELDQRVLHRATCGTLGDHDDQYQMICGSRDELEGIMEPYDTRCPACL